MQSEIGKDIMETKPHKTCFTQHSKLFDDRWKQKILDVLRDSNHLLNIQEITKRLNHGNWMTVKQALIDLAIEGKVEHFRSGRVLLFRLKE